jgi:hypothetical protein
MSPSGMDSKGFVSSVEEHLANLAPITKFIIIKQLKDLNTSKENLTPDKALIFINNMTKALVMCLGKDGSQLARKMMMKQLRLHAPGFLEKEGIPGQASSSV